MIRWMTLAVTIASTVLVLGGCKSGEVSSRPTASAAQDEGTEATGPPETTADEYTYVCPMHPDEAAEKPAKCGACGMFMEADTDEEVEYWCPMHPDVVQADPGECDPCGGMILPARPVQ